jgi:hypothetical protein
MTKTGTRAWQRTRTVVPRSVPGWDEMSRPCPNIGLGIRRRWTCGGRHSPPMRRARPSACLWRAGCGVGGAETSGVMATITLSRQPSPPSLRTMRRASPSALSCPRERVSPRFERKRTGTIPPWATPLAYRPIPPCAAPPASGAVAGASPDTPHRRPNAKPRTAGFRTCRLLPVGRRQKGFARRAKVRRTERAGASEPIAGFQPASAEPL